MATHPSNDTKESKSTLAKPRRDATGHIDPQYAKELLEKSGKSTNEQGDRAFLAASRSGEELSEELGENFVASATSGEEATAERHDAMNEAERGGPYVVTSDAEEFAVGVDESNPKSATREPFPKT